MTITVPKQRGRPRREPRPENRPYCPYGAARTLWECKDTEIMVSGPAGTGKSRACLEKVHFCAEKYAGARFLLFRKSRKSLTESALVTFEEKVLPARHGALGGVRRENRHAYHYPNGSTVVVGGLDDPSKIMSTEYDMVFAQEARELTEADWESVSIRCRNGVMPYQQAIADTNPDAPHHWIKRRERDGKLTMMESRHEDNPMMWDRYASNGAGGAGTWTPEGAKYIERLEALTGVRYERLRKGLWVQAEGLIYDAWDPAVFLVDRFPIPHTWPRYWSVDFGYTNPFVCLFLAQDPDGRLYLYRELYMTQRLVEDHARRILSVCGADKMGWDRASEPRPRAIICDHDAEDRATLERHLRMPTQAAIKEISPGLQAVASRLRVPGDGKPRLVIFKDALDERDPVLDEAKKPTCTAEEFEGYTWDTGGGRRKGEQPVDRDNHGMDAIRYAIFWLDGKPRGEWGKSDADGGRIGAGAIEGVAGRRPAPEVRGFPADGKSVAERAPRGAWG